MEDTTESNNIIEEAILHSKNINFFSREQDNIKIYEDFARKNLENSSLEILIFDLIVRNCDLYNEIKRIKSKLYHEYNIKI